MFSVVEIHCGSLKLSKEICSHLLSKQLAESVGRIRGERCFFQNGVVVEDEDIILRAKCHLNQVEQVMSYLKTCKVTDTFCFQNTGSSQAVVTSNELLKKDVVSEENGLKLRGGYLGAKPFPKFRLENAFSDDFLEDVFDTLATQGNFEPRANDLYSFNQSEDLRVIGETSETIKKLAETLYSNQMISFLSAITGIQLNNEVDMSATLYTKGCHLLTHDDRMTTRRIAFILYLTPKVWAEKDGGHLRFYYQFKKNKMPNPHKFEQVIFCCLFLSISSILLFFFFFFHW